MDAKSRSSATQRQAERGLATTGGGGMEDALPVVLAGRQTGRQMQVRVLPLRQSERDRANALKQRWPTSETEPAVARMAGFKTVKLQ